VSGVAQAIFAFVAASNDFSRIVEIAENAGMGNTFMPTNREMFYW
jgi:hypothetical protein